MTRRFAFVAAVRPDRVDEYRTLHAAVWPSVLRMIEECQIRNYSIFLKELPDGRQYLFSYLEYAGDDFEQDMQKMAQHEETQRWWDLCKPCLEPVGDLPPGEVWAPMEQVFFHA
jgi:L-rhamnose mutarotase